MAFVHRIRAEALARSTYRSLLRAVECASTSRAHARVHVTDTDTDDTDDTDDRGSGRTHNPSLRRRATDVVLARVRERARVGNIDANANANTHSARIDGALKFASSCAMATAFFMNVNADANSSEAAHARALVGYVDGENKYAKERARKKPGKKTNEANAMRENVRQAWEEVFFASRARVAGLVR